MTNTAAVAGAADDHGPGPGPGHGQGDHNLKVPKVFRCAYVGCTKTFNRRDYLERHAANHLSSLPHLCPTCGKSYARADVLKRHMTNHPKGRKRSSASSPQTPATSKSEQDVSPSGSSSQVSSLDKSLLAAVADTDVLQGALNPIPEPAWPAGLFEEPFDYSTLSVDDLCTWLWGPTAPACQFTGPDLVEIALQPAVVPPRLPAASDDKPDTETSLPAHLLAAARQLMESLSKEATSWKDSDMQACIELFFEHFDPMWPIIHRPTFIERNPSPQLIVAMAIIGSIYLGNLLISGIVVELQPRLQENVQKLLRERTSVSTSLLQALALNSYFGRVCGYGNQRQAQIDHAALVTTMYLSGILVGETHASASPQTSDRHADWLAWVEREERIRLAWFVFAEDVHNATILRQCSMVGSLIELLQCHSISRPLPAPDVIWSADSVVPWIAESPRHAPTPFRPALRQLLDSNAISESLGSLARLALLHALMALTLPLSYAGIEDLQPVRQASTSDDRGAVYEAFKCWQRCSMGGPEGAQPGSQASLGLPLATTCVTLLATDIDAIVTYTGADRMLPCPQCGNTAHLADPGARPTTPRERSEARDALRAWAGSTTGRISCWESLQMLQVVFASSADRPAAMLPPTMLHSVAIATLVIWTYTTLIEDRPQIDVWPWCEPLDPALRCRIEPRLAYKAALSYIERVLACEDSINLPAVSNSGRFAGVLAYAAHLCGSVDWAIVAAPTRVLYSLLKHAQAGPQNYARC